MKKYFVRAAKYIVQLTVLFAVLFTLMKLTGTATHDGFSDIFASARGIAMLATLFLLSFLYPVFGFVSRTVKADIAADRDKIIQALAMCGYDLDSESDGSMLFRAGTAKRVMLLWEDGITIARDDNYITMSGVRSQVVKAEFRLKSML